MPFNRRKCLMCLKDFNSAGPSNRRCPKCGKIASKIFIPGTRECEVASRKFKPPPD